MKVNNKLNEITLTLPNGVSFSLKNNLETAFNWEQVRNRTLDTGHAQFILMENEFEGFHSEETIEPYSIIELSFLGQETKIRLAVQSDKVETVRKWKSGIYRHHVTFVSESKLLERDISDTVIFATPIDRYYQSDADTEWTIFKNGSVLNEYDVFSWEPPTFKITQERGTTLSISDNASSFEKYYDNTGTFEEKQYITELELTVTSPRMRQYKYQSALEGTHNTYYDTIHNIALTETGEYKFSFFISAINYSGQGVILRSATFETTIAVGSANDILRPYTVAESIDRLLNVSEIHRASQQNRYYLSERDREILGSEEAPNFSFTVSNLAEGLQAIGSYTKERFPKLTGREISFEPLWNGEIITEDEIIEKALVFDRIAERSGNDYATFLDCSAENVVGMLDGKKATVIEPYIGGYKTVRSSSGSAITENSAMIATGAIYQYVGLSMGSINGKEIGDITPYVFEENDYQSLTDYASAFPYSKAYALKWVQMQGNITELSHRVTTSSMQIANNLELPAIANIVGAVSPKTEVGTGAKDYIVDLWRSAFGDDFSYDIDAKSFASLMFQTEYNPVMNIRSRIYRDFDEGFSRKGGLLFNQSETVMDSELLGENLHGTIERMGHQSTLVTYQFAKIDDVPKIGTLVDDYLIFGETMQIRPDCVIVTIAYTKYAEVASSSALKSEKKTSDVSRTKYAVRNVNYGEFGYFSHTDTVAYSSIGTMLVGTAPEQLLTFTAPRKASAVKATGYTHDGEPLNTVFLPLITFPIGHSLQFSWKYEGNMSAGNMSVPAPNLAVSGTTGTKYNRAQKAVVYTDAYGRLKTYDFEIMRSGMTKDDTGIRWELEPQEISVTVNTSTRKAPLSYPRYEYSLFIELAGATVVSIVPPIGSTSAEVDLADGQNAVTVVRAYLTDKEFIARQIGHSLPLLPDNVTINGNAWTAREPFFHVPDLLVDKNGSEALSFDVQFHFKQDFKDFIIGNGVTQFSALVGGSTKEIGLYVFPKGVNRYERYVDVRNGTKVADNLSWIWNANRNRMQTTLPSAVDGNRGWALIGKTDSGLYEIIFGENNKDKVFKKDLYLYFAGNEHDWQSRVEEDERVKALFYNDAIVEPYLFKSEEWVDVKAKFYDDFIVDYPLQSEDITDVDIVSANFYDDRIVEKYPITSEEWSIKSAKFYDDAIVEPYPITSEEAPKVSVKFMNENTVLFESQVSVLGTPMYTGSTPTKSSDERYDYTFNGWSPAIGKVFTDTVYTAQFSAKKREYTISVDVTNQNGTVLWNRSAIGGYDETVTFVPIAKTHYSTKTVSVKIGDHVSALKATKQGYEGNTYTAYIYYKRDGQDIGSMSFSTKYPNAVGSVFNGAPSTLSNSYGAFTFSKYTDEGGNDVTLNHIKSQQLTNNSAKWYAIYTDKLWKVTIVYKNESGTEIATRDTLYKSQGYQQFSAKTIENYNAIESSQTVSITSESTITFIYRGQTYQYQIAYRNYMTNAEIQARSTYTVLFPNNNTSGYPGAPSSIRGTDGNVYTFSHYRDEVGNYITLDHIRSQVLTNKDNPAVWYADYRKN